jgi:hypothetical protein
VTRTMRIERAVRLAVGAALAALAICAGPLSDTASGAATVPWGFNEDWGYESPGVWSSTLTTRHMDVAGQIMPDPLSANRFHIHWARIESKRGTYDWTETDRQYAAMAQYTPNPVMLIFGAPVWASDRSQTCPSAPCAYPPLPKYDKDWSKFVRAAASRYPNVRAIEVWNEPNIARFWAPAPDATRYVTILKLAYNAVQTTRATAPILVGGLTPAANGSTTIGAGEFLTQVYTKGCACYFDGIGAHPYTTQDPLVENMTKRLDKLRAVRDARGDTPTPLWITEIGLSSDGTTGVTVDNQGTTLVALYRSIEGRDVASFIIHRFHDIGYEGSYWNQTGVVHDDQALSPKPAYCQLWSEIGSPEEDPTRC